MTRMPRDVLADALDLSITALNTVIAGIKVASDTMRHQLLLPESEKGLQEGLFVYKLILTEAAISVNVRAVTQLLANYGDAWSYLFDAVRAVDRTLATPTQTARNAQKAAQRRLVAILNCEANDGQDEYDALRAALTALSEALGDVAESAAKKSRKGIPHESFETHVPDAEKWSGVSASTIRRYWRNPIKGLSRPPLKMPGTVELRKRLFERWGDEYRSMVAGKHEANMKNHPIPMTSVGKRTQRQAGFTR